MELRCGSHCHGCGKWHCDARMWCWRRASTRQTMWRRYRELRRKKFVCCRGRLIRNSKRWLRSLAKSRLRGIFRKGEWLEDLAEENGVRRHVHFLSGLSYAELAACYAHCEIFALPSKGEGFGLVYLEAMACGKPVIGGAHGGAPEVIDDGKTGYLVAHGDAARARCDGSYRGLGVRIARGVRKKCGQREALSVWMDERSERRAKRLLADVVPLPRGDLESCDRQILPGTAWRLRCGAHFRLIRLTRSRSRPRVPETENSISHRADRNVCAHRAKYFSEARVPCTVGQRNAARGSRADCDGGAGSGGASRGGDSAYENRAATERSYGTATIAGARRISP